MPIRSYFSRLFRRDEGQILLIVVLVMVTSLTVGLALVSRSITNIRTSTEESNSQKALSAAEAGIEKKIQTQGNTGTITSSLGNNASYTTSVTTVGQATTLRVKNGGIIPADEPQDIWLVPYDNFIDSNNNAGWAGSQVTIYWGDPQTSPPVACQQQYAALEVLVLRLPANDDKNNPILDKYAVDPCAARRSDNNFSDDPPTPDGGTVRVQGVDYTYEHSKAIDIAPGQGLVMRIIPIYHDTKIAIRSSGAPASQFVRQGFVLDSTGTSGSTERKITVYQGYPRLPSELFPYNLFLP